MGLYDGIRGDSSQLIDTHVALPLAEMQKASDVKDQRYDNTLQSLDALNGTMKTAVGFFNNDKALLAGSTADANKDIDAYAKAGNYENLGRAVTMTARRFGNTYAQVNANTQGYRDYAQNLQDMQNSRNPNTSIDPIKAKDALATALKEYGDGLQIDPATGKYTNYFRGAIPAATYDVPGELLKHLKELHPFDKEIQNTNVGNIAGDPDTDAARALHQNIKHTRLQSSAELSQDRIYKLSQLLLNQSPRLLADLESRSDLHYRAQDRGTNIQEYFPLFADEQGRREKAMYKQAHPRAGQDDLDGAYAYGTKNAQSKYQDLIASNPSFDPAKQLAANKYAQDKGMAGAVDAGILEQHATKDISSITGENVQPKAVDATVNPNELSPTGTLDIPDEKTKVSYESLKASIAGADQARKDNLAEIAKFENKSKLPNGKPDPKAINYAPYIAKLKAAQPGLEEAYSTNVASRTTFLHETGLDIPSTPESIQKAQKDYDDGLVVKEKGFIADYNNSGLWKRFGMGLQSVVGGNVNSDYQNMLGRHSNEASQQAYDPGYHMPSQFDKSPVSVVTDWITGADSIQQDPRFKAQEANYFEKQNAPSFTTTPTIQFPEGIRKVVEKSYDMWGRGSSLKLIGAAGGQNTGEFISTALRNQIDSFTGYQAAGNGIAAVAHIKASKAGPSQSFVVWLPNTAATQRYTDAAINVSAAARQAATQRETLTSNGLEQRQSNGRANGEGGTIYTRADNNQIKAVYTNADGSKEGNFLTPAEHDQERTQEFSPSGQEATQAITKLYNTGATQHIGGEKDGKDGLSGASFTLRADGDIDYTTYTGNPGEVPVTRVLKERKAENMHFKVNSKYKEYKAKNGQ